MVVWLSVPTSVSGKATRAAVLLLGPHGLRQIFEIHLVADAGAGRHHAEIVEGAGAPAQERVALAVPLIFLLDIGEERGGGAERIDRHRVIDDEVDRNQRIDLARVAAERAHGVAHGGKIDHGGDAGEILHQHARRAEGDLALALPRLQPLGHAANVVGGDGAPVFMPQQIFEQHLQRERQAADAGEPVRLGLLQIEIIIAALADLQRPPAIETVERGLCYRCQLGSPRARAQVYRELGDRLTTCKGLANRLAGSRRPSRRGSLTHPGLLEARSPLYKSPRGSETMREKRLGPRRFSCLPSYQLAQIPGKCRSRPASPPMGSPASAAAGSCSPI